jgi:hypothetical protein
MPSWARFDRIAVRDAVGYCSVSHPAKRSNPGPARKSHMVESMSAAPASVSKMILPLTIGGDGA